MKSINDLLGRFSNLKPPDDALKKAIISAIRAGAGVPLEKKDIALRNGTAFVNASSVAKSAIRAKRGAVLDELYLLMPDAKRRIRDIR